MVSLEENSSCCEEFTSSDDMLKEAELTKEEWIREKSGSINKLFHQLVDFKMGLVSKRMYFYSADEHNCDK